RHCRGDRQVAPGARPPEPARGAPQRRRRDVMTSHEYQADGRFLSPYLYEETGRRLSTDFRAVKASPGCEAHGRDLGPFIDGELDGLRMLRMSRHLDECDACAAAVEEMLSVGQILREVVPADPPLALF